MRTVLRTLIAILCATVLPACGTGGAERPLSRRSAEVSPARSNEPEASVRPDASGEGLSASSRERSAATAIGADGGTRVAASAEEHGSPLIAVGTGLDHEGGLYTVRADGSDIKEVSDGLEQAHNPAWSPDGRYVAFDGSNKVGEEDQESGIYRVDADGTGQRKLTTRGWGPDWAPDGSQIVFQLADGAGRTHVAVMRADGTGVKRLTSSLMYESSPRWSPRGDWIAYVDTAARLRVIRPDGTGDHPISPLGPSIAGAPDWSPDGRSLAYVGRDVSGTQWTLHVVDVSLGRDRTIARSYFEWAPSWSPDGRWIAYVGHETLIAVVRPDGTGYRPVTKRQGDGGFQTTPVWSPDGTEIAHIQWEGRGKTVWVQPLDGDPAHRVFSDQPASSLTYQPSTGS